ncbi:MAG: hypothetical protein LWX56_12135 [Ignavibacteria bacterium]|nr:hypothetical protein [Ignavibacteria bacterium]
MLQFIRELFVRIFIYNYRGKFLQRNFSAEMGKYNSAAILVPADDKVAEAIRELADQLVRKRKAVTLVLPATQRPKFDGIKNLRFQEYFPVDISKFGLPKGSFLEKMRFLEADILISFDFGTDNFLQVASLMAKSRVKIGYRSKFSDKIFHIQLASDKNLVRDSINNLIHCYQII